MKQTILSPLIGAIRRIEASNDCCSQTLSLATANGPANITISPDTFVVDTLRLRPGMRIAAFYDPNLPMPLIFPPNYRAMLVTGLMYNENVYYGFFDDHLIADSNQLALYPDTNTEIVTSNGQLYPCVPANQNLLVYYSTTTRSIPPQTVPRKIIVFC